MAILNNNQLVGASGSQGYKINNSLRFRSSASAYLNRTPSGSSGKTWTWSSWVKRGSLSSTQGIVSAYASATINTNAVIAFNATDNLIFVNGSGLSPAGTLFTSTASYRDPSAWYHLVVTLDVTQTGLSNQLKFYINGNQVTGTYGGTAFSNTAYPIGNNFVNRIAANGDSAGAVQYFDGYMTEVNFIDGQALTPSSFGLTDPVTGVWQPRQYAGAYGTNGFYLKFADASGATATTIGKDSSGNGNNWTPNNISVTAGVTYDAMTDSPTLTSSTVANYAVLNPLLTGGTVTPSNGNLTSSGTDAANQSSFPMQTGKWYAEATLTTLASQDVTVGIISTISAVTSISNAGGYGWGVRLGRKWINGSVTTGFSTAVNGDIAGLAFDADSGQLDVYKNNVLVFSITGIPTGTIYNFTNGVGGTTGSNTVNWNFGQRPFTYTPPTGYKALNTYNLPDSTISVGNKYMDATLYTGTGATLSITNAGAFKPDFVWMKGRSNVRNNNLYDSVRGTTKELNSNTTGAETTNATGLTAFNSNGWTIGSDGGINTSSETYVGWQWQAGQGSTSSNTSGSITSTVSVNASAGFSIVTYTGTGSAATVGHGLGVAPKFIIIKNRSGVYNWACYHANLTSASYWISLNQTNAQALNTDLFNGTAPTSSVFSVGISSNTNASTNSIVAYCWAEIAGFSKFGSYTGNGSADGPFIYTGFRPKYVLTKRTDTISDWIIYDTSRNTYNVTDLRLYPNLSTAETQAGAMDLLSNGFKLRDTGASQNASGGTYIYAAYAENPFKNSLAR